MNSLISFLLTGLVIMLTAYVVPGVTVSTFLSALAVTLILALLNLFVKPVLLLLTLPVNILTLGLFTFVINVLIIYLAAAIVPGFRVNSFFAALLFGLLVGLLTSIFNLG